MRKITYMLCLLVMTLFYTSNECYSSEVVDNNLKDFSYSIEYPENQIDKGLGYFDLAMTAGDSQSAFIEVSNRSTEELSILISLNAAKTNEGGQVEYGPNSLKKDSSQKIDINDVIDVPKTVTIPPRSSTTIKLRISIPNEAETGMIVGGIQLKLDNKLEDKVGIEGDDDVVNEFAYLLGVVLRVGDTETMHPEIKLNDIKLAEKDGRSVLLISLSNIQAVFAEEISMSLSVGKVNKSKSVFEYTQSNMRMAPNSRLELPIDLSDKRMTSGRYDAYLTLKMSDGEEESWSQKIDISLAEGIKIRENYQKNSWWSARNKTLIVIMVLLCTTGLATWYVIFKKQGLKIK